jgi:phosphate uptake regulator
VTRSLERIGDHATNIAETTLYVADGRLERHATPTEPGSGER